MPAYTYEALDAEGRTQTGLMEADTVRAARTALRLRGWIPLQVTPAAPAPAASGAAATRWTRRAFRGSDLAIWTQQLAGLVTAGLPLERALQSLADEAPRPATQHLLAHLRAEVNAGSSFARALALYPQDFDASYTAVVAAGEQSGQLGPVLLSLANDLEERDRLRQQLISATLYPAIITVFALAIVVFLMTYVVPQVANAFASGKRALPTLTVLMLGLSHALRQWGWVLALGGVLGGTALSLAHRRPSWRLRLDGWWLRLPLLGSLAAQYNAARFAATLALLAQAGVPILRALQTAADTLNNRALQTCAQEALVMVREGAPLASALAAQRRFPGLLPLFARLGEQTGQLPAMLHKAAQQLSAQVQRRALRLATLLEPLLIVAMGAVVLVIVLAVMLPIIQLNQLVK